MISLLQYTKAGEVAAYIRETCRNGNSNQLKLSVLSRKFLMCERLLTSSFRKRYRTSIHAYIITQRSEYICELLAGRLPVNEIASMAGYTELSNFSRDFARIKGMAPRDYRDSLQKDSQPQMMVRSFPAIG